MTLLSKRVQKSKRLVFKAIPVWPKIVYGTTSHEGKHWYQVRLEKARESSMVGNVQMDHDTINVTCLACHEVDREKLLPVSDCPGNSAHTVCYHSLGAIRHHLASKGYTIAFCQDIFAAIKLQKPGETIVKVVSTQGGGVLWAVAAEKPKTITDKLAANTLAMRLSEKKAEGID